MQIKKKQSDDSSKQEKGEKQENVSELNVLQPNVITAIDVTKQNMIYQRKQEKIETNDNINNNNQSENVLKNNVYFKHINTYDELIDDLQSIDKKNCLTFIDIDQTMVIPKTPFIWGLPKTDAFVSNLYKQKKYNNDEIKYILQQMESQYYASELR